MKYKQIIEKLDWYVKDGRMTPCDAGTIKYLLAQKEDRKECKHNWKLTPDTWGETCFYCGKQRKIKTTPSPLEIEEIEEYFYETSCDRKIINKLIRNQKKLYQFIKDKL